MVSKSDLLFQQWVASLATRDRTKKAVQNNFEDLFRMLKNEGLVLESAYEYLPKAIKAHSPSASLIRNKYKQLKVAGAISTPEKEFADSWNKDIADKANVAFFDVFPIETKTEEPEDPVIYGSMTAKEYRAQRKHAESYPVLDTEELERRIQKTTYDPMQDLTTLLGSTSGDPK